MQSLDKTVSANYDQDADIAAKQKEVYNWYEARYNDDVVDIYSPKWQQRITSWHEWVRATYGAQDVQSKSIDPNKKLDDHLDLRRLFFQDPIAAYSLWHVLQACYAIDEAVCGTSPNTKEALRSWQEMKPFVYFRSKRVRERWRSELRKLNKQIERGELREEALMLRMFTIHRGVEKLEDSIRTLKENFSAELKDTELGKSMLERVDKMFEKRCSLIAKNLNNDQNAHQVTAAETEDDSPHDDSLAESYPDMSAINPFDTSVKQDTHDIHPRTENEPCLDLSNQRYSLSTSYSVLLFVIPWLFLCLLIVVWRSCSWEEFEYLLDAWPTIFS